MNIVERSNARRGCKTCGCAVCNPAKSADLGKAKWDANDRCANCGCPALEWVATSGNPNVKSSLGGWRVIPFGTTDFSGSVHALTFGQCGKVSDTSVRGTEIRNRMTNNGATNTAPIELGGVSAPSVDLSGIQAELDDMRKRIDNLPTSNGSTVDVARIEALEKQHSALAPMIDAIGTKIDERLADWQTKVDNLNSARPIQIVSPNLPTVDVGRQHMMFANLLVTANAVKGSGVPMMVGPAGSMKSSAIAPIAKAMGLRFLPFVCGQSHDETDFLGYTDANGRFVDKWGFADFYENGGIIFLDEVGNLSANGATSLNGLISNDVATFASGKVIKRSPNCIFIAADNTFGRGADAMYIGRSQLDAATLNRMVYLPWETDWSLVGDLYGLTIKGDKPDYAQPGKPRTITDKDCAEWGEFIKSLFEIVAAKKIAAAIGTRQVINGLKMLLAGIDRKLVEYAVIWAHMDDADAAIVRANMKGSV